MASPSILSSVASWRYNKNRNAVLVWQQYSMWLLYSGLRSGAHHASLGSLCKKPRLPGRPTSGWLDCSATQTRDVIKQPVHPFVNGQTLNTAGNGFQRIQLFERIITGFSTITLAVLRSECVAFVSSRRRITLTSASFSAATKPVSMSRISARTASATSASTTSLSASRASSVSAIHA